MKSTLVSIDAVLVLAAGCGDNDNDGNSATRAVRPGESIQAAVDAASPGETIKVMPGDYAPEDWPSQPFRNWTVVDNQVYDNNLPNPVSGGVVGALPSGAGILVVGVDGVDLRENRISNNDFFGIAMVDYCIAVDGTANMCPELPAC